MLDRKIKDKESFREKLMLKLVGSNFFFKIIIFIILGLVALMLNIPFEDFSNGASLILGVM